MRFILQIIIITVLSLALDYIFKSLLWSADAIYHDFFQLTNIMNFTRTFLYQ